MKNIFIMSVLLLITVFSCRKDDDNLNISMDDYPTDNAKTNSALDQWLNQNFNIPWNINVEYRFDTYETDYTRNISVVSLDKVQPAMQAIIDCFIGPYAQVVDSIFGKKYFPKQWVLYGSYSYNTDNTVVLGTASAARRVDLYGLNLIPFTNGGDSVQRMMRTMHHEFTHCLNQTYPIPSAFELISAANYDPSWSGKTDAQARDLGFVSPYASSAYTEDFAEMVAHIVVLGPIWYNNWLNQASATAKTALKAKEAIIYDYLLNYFNVDLYKLQAAVQTALKTKYNISDPEDITLSFPFRLSGATVNTITIDTTASHYTTYGKSATFTTLINNYATALKANNWYMKYVQFIFTSSSTMTFRVAFTQGASGTTVYYGDYDFGMSVTPSTGLTVFTKSTPESSGTTYSNGQISTILSPFEMYMLPYLVNRQFIATYLPTAITSSDPLYRTFAGFYVNGTPSNYFYGPVTYK